MKSTFLIGLLIAICSQATGQTTYSKETAAKISQVENSLSGRLVIDGKTYHILDRMAHYKVKGASIAVIRNYELAWAKGYGYADESEKRSVTTETLFEPGSISKSLNAVGALRLVQEKKLDLYADINLGLKSWKFPYDSVSKGKVITLAHLLSHTAGLSVYGFGGYERGGKLPTLPQILDGLPPAISPAVRSVSEPGKQFQYSGGGVLISQQMILDATGMPYEQFMKEQVLNRLGMLNSSFQQPPAKANFHRLASGYYRDGTAVKDKFFVNPEMAAAGLWTTPTDLSRYIIEMQLAWQGKSAKVLNQQLAKLHLTPYIDAHAAMGTFVQERGGAKYFFHDAANIGYKGLYMASLEGGDGVVVFVNSENGELLLELLNSVALAYNWPGFEKPRNIQTVALSQRVAETYTGVYLYEGKVAEVRKEKDGLYFWTSGQNSKMYFTSEQDFINLEFPSEKAFVTDGSGKVTGYSRKVNGQAFPPSVKVLNLDTLTAKPGEMGNFGWHLLETKRYEEAIRILKRAGQLEPSEPSIQINLAHAYLFKGDFEAAIAGYQKYLQRTPDDKQARQSLLRDFDLFSQSGFDQADIKKAKTQLEL